MREVKIFCDKCGKQVREGQQYELRCVQADTPDNIILCGSNEYYQKGFNKELCEFCQEKVRLFIDTKEVTT